MSGRPEPVAEAGGPVPGGPGVGPFPGCLDADRVRRWAAATGDPWPAARAGTVVPPVAVVTQIWEAQEGARDSLVPVELQARASGAVHGEHDIVLHRPVEPGEPLRTWVDAHGTRPAGRNSLVTLRYLTVDAAGRPVAEQWWTTVYLGVTGPAQGAPAPDHAFPDAARDRPLGTAVVPVDADLARRYAEISGDWSPHHFDLEAARRSGVDRPFLHGLCTLALCAREVARVAAGGDPRRLRRLAVRFAAPTFLGEDLHVRVFDAGPQAVAFEADSAGATVLAHGRAELR